jgi:hypothetical protein
MDLQNPENLDSVSIISHRYQQIRPARVIIFAEEFDGMISNIPEGVERIEIRGSCYGSLRLPSSLKSLYIDCNFDELVIPDCLIHLELGKRFKGKVVQWPKSLKSLSMYDADVNSLPDSLEYLKLNSDDISMRIGMTQALNQSLKQSLKRLIISPHLKNMRLEDLHNLEYLEFMKWSCCGGIHYIDAKLPPNLRILKGCYIRVELTEKKLPDSLEYFEGDIVTIYDRSKVSLPRNLKVLKCNLFTLTEEFPPQSLEYLVLHSIRENTKLHWLGNLKTLICEFCPRNYLPSSLEYLEIKCSESGVKLRNLPSSLRTLVVPRSVLQPEVALPRNIVKLKILDCENPLKISIPSGLKVIEFESVK